MRAVQLAIDAKNEYSQRESPMVMREKGSFWKTLPGILTGVAAVISAAAAILAAMPQFVQVAPEPETAIEAPVALWQRNWQTVSAPRGALGASGRNWINRDQFVTMLRALEFPRDDPLEGVKSRLLTLALSTPEDLSNGPQWSLPYTQDMQHLEAELKRGVRDRAIAHGIDVRNAMP
jgi:hypothetical protein